MLWFPGATKAWHCFQLDAAKLPASLSSLSPPLVSLSLSLCFLTFMCSNTFLHKEKVNVDPSVLVSMVSVYFIAAGGLIEGAKFCCGYHLKPEKGMNPTKPRGSM